MCDCTKRYPIVSMKIVWSVHKIYYKAVHQEYWEFAFWNIRVNLCGLNCEIMTVDINLRKRKICLRKHKKSCGAPPTLSLQLPPTQSKADQTTFISIDIMEGRPSIKQVKSCENKFWFKWSRIPSPVRPLGVRSEFCALKFFIIKSQWMEIWSSFRKNDLSDMPYW